MFGAWVALTTVGLLDELGTGIPITGAALLRSRFELSASTLTLALFTIPVGFATIVEPPLLLWASRLPRARGAAVGLVGIALAALLAAFARSYEALVGALMLWYVATGLASGLAQAELMDLAPTERERNLSRWTLASAVGDLVAPSLLAASVAYGLADRGALVAVAACCVATALWLLRLPRSVGEVEEEPEPLFRAPPQAVTHNRPLMAWLFAAALCDLMDETLTALAALRVHQYFGADPHALAVVLTAFMASSFVGLTLLDRLLPHVSARRLLLFACIGGAAAYLVFVNSQTVAGMALAAFVMELFIVVHYPIAQAQAYAAAPEHSGWVATLSSILSGLSLAYAPLLGWIADAYGLTWALLLLLVQPTGVLLMMLVAARDATP